MTSIVLTSCGNLPIIKQVAWLLGQVMNALFNVLDLIGIPNIGLAIFLFTIIVYLLMMPLTIKQQKFSKLSAKMNPELQAIRNKYKNRTDTDSQMQMNAETQAVYAKYGVSPTGSCLQLFIQMPILFALYEVIYSIPSFVTKIGNAFSSVAGEIISSGKVSAFVESVKGASTYITNVDNVTESTLINALNRVNYSDVEVFINSNFAGNATVAEGMSQIERYNSFLVKGFRLANSPSSVVTSFFNSGNAGKISVAMLIIAIAIPVLSAVTQWVNVMLMPKQETGNGNGDMTDTMASSMKTMNMIMPIMSAFFCYTLPAGLGLYWISGSLVRSVQQVVINKHIDKMDLDEVIAKNADKSAKKMEKLEKNQAKLQQYANMNTKNMGGTVSTKNYTAKTTDTKNANTDNKEVKKTSSTGAKPGSLMAKANLVKDYNERNNKN